MKLTIEPRPLDRGSLWMLTIAPTIWAAHLLLCYITAAIWCARFAPADGPLGGVHTAIMWYSAVALAGIATTGWEGLRRHSYGTEATTHDLDTAEDRHRFLGFATLLLSGLSAVGVIYAALAATYFETCR
ncbi:MAG: hypothetical protein ACREUZ_05315 [Burkholderiales bacterium]